MKPDLALPEHPGFEITRLLTRKEAKTLPNPPKGTGKVVEARCLHTGQLTYHLAIVWRAAEKASHKHCCGDIRQKSTAPTNKVQFRLYLGDQNRLTLAGQKHSLHNIWSREAPQHPTHGRLDAQLAETGEVFSTDLNEAHLAVLKWWCSMERDPSIWAPLPALAISNPAPQAATVPPRIVVFPIVGGLGALLRADLSTPTPTLFNQDVRAWLLLNLLENSYAIDGEIPVPEVLGDSFGDARAQTLHTVRWHKWPAPANPTRKPWLRYSAPRKEALPVWVEDPPNVQQIFPAEDGAIELLRRPRPVEMLPKNRHLSAEHWDITDLEPVDMVVPAHWETLPYCA